MKRLVFILIIACIMLLISVFMGSGHLLSDDDPENLSVKSAISQQNFESIDRGFNRLFRDDCVKTLTVKIPRNEWNGIITDMKVYSIIDDRMRTGNFRKADLVYEDRDGTFTLTDVGIRTKGNTTRILPQEGNNYHRANFKIKFNMTSNEEQEDEENNDNKGRKYAGLDSIILKACMNDSSYVHEKFAYDLLARAGAKAPVVTTIRLVFDIDGEIVDYGIYTMIEPIDDEFIKRRYEVSESIGNLYKCLWQSYGPATLTPIRDMKAIGVKDWTKNYRPAYDLKTNKKEQNHSALTNFIYQLNTLNGEELKVWLDENFEVDSFLSYLACNLLVGMPDDYWAMGNNYYLYFNNTGKIEFIPYDYDHCLASGWDGTYFGGYEGIARSDILEWKDLAAFMTGENLDRPLVEKILSIDEYRAKYFALLEELINPENKMFSYESFLSLYNNTNRLYGAYINNDTDEVQRMELTNEKWYFEEKIESVKSQLDRLQPLK